MTTPVLHRLGETALIVEFAPVLTDAANRAALAFRAAVEAADWPGMLESFVTLKSVMIRFNPDEIAHAEITDRLTALLAERDWFAAPLPPGRTRWTIPAAFGGEEGPQLAEVASLIGASEAALIDEVAASTTRVLTIGFAPGQPYLGQLPPRWDIPRQTALTPRVAPGALVAAIRQIVLFTVANQTGWRQIGLSAFEGYRPKSEHPFPLRVGDEVMFEPVSRDDLTAWQERARDGALAARQERIE
jgi:inhibitor of KinA